MADRDEGSALKKLAGWIAGIAAVIAALIAIDQSLAKFDASQSFTYRLFHPNSPVNATNAKNPPVDAPPAEAAVPAPTSAPRPIRIFIHVQVRDANSVRAAEILAKQIDSIRISGLTISTPKVRTVEAVPSVTELRCLKHKDCEIAETVAQALAGVVGQSVIVRRMDVEFDADPDVHDGSFELWLPK